MENIIHRRQVMERYLNEKQVAAITGMALSTLRNARFMGKGIRYTKIGRSVRYRYKDVLDFLKKGAIQTESMQ
jgi:predicted DNA-binding transcriptional regulator AlpA